MSVFHSFTNFYVHNYTCKGKGNYTCIMLFVLKYLNNIYAFIFTRSCSFVLYTFAREQHRIAQQYHGETKCRILPVTQPLQMKSRISDLEVMDSLLLAAKNVKSDSRHKKTVNNSDDESAHNESTMTPRIIEFME